MNKIGFIIAATLATSCSPAEQQTAQLPTAQAASFDTTIPLNEVMAHAMDPAAFQFWKGSGVTLDASGTTDTSPKTEAEWKAVEDGAATVLLLTNVLKLQGYARGPGDKWFQYTDGVAAVAARGREAAEKQNAQVMEEIGGELYDACEACHEAFIANYTN